jgi:indole-3-glycerol phosphate synthase
MSDLLADMARESRGRCEAARSLAPLSAVKTAAGAAAPVRPLRLDERFDLIAELKLRAPSVGKLASLSPERLVLQGEAYVRAGAAAISVLTEPSRFDGELAHLEAVAAAVPIPVMRKDFLVDPYQVWEARAAGASGVLLIARMLTVEALKAMLETARETGMFSLIELFGEDDLEKLQGLALDSEGPPVLVGVNSRDLRSLEVVPERLARLAGLLPKQVPAVAESGLRTADDVGQVAGFGYRLALVGSALMANADPEGLAAAMLRAGRSP